MRRSTSLLLFLVLSLAMGVVAQVVPASAQNDDTFQIVYVVVRQGDGAIYQGPCGAVAVIDTPRHRHADMAAALDAYVGTRTIEWANVSHYHADHVGGLEALDGLAGVSIGTVYDRGGDQDAYSSATYHSYHEWVTSSATSRQPVDIGDVLTLCSGSQQVTFEVR